MSSLSRDGALALALALAMSISLLLWFSLYSFAKEPYKKDNVLQKRLMNLKYIVFSLARWRSCSCSVAFSPALVLSLAHTQALAFYRSVLQK